MRLRSASTKSAESPTAPDPAPAPPALNAEAGKRGGATASGSVCRNPPKLTLPLVLTSPLPLSPTKVLPVASSAPPAVALLVALLATRSPRLSPYTTLPVNDMPLNAGFVESVSTGSTPRGAVCTTPSDAGAQTPAHSTNAPSLPMIVLPVTATFRESAHTLIAASGVGFSAGTVANHSSSHQEVLWPVGRLWEGCT